jgi:bacterioferritin-associated ferredoxin
MRFETRIGLFNPHYQPQETLGNLGKGFACYEEGKVVHLVDDIESDGYYRSGICLCNRLPDEEVDAVEIYPVETFEEIVNEFGENNICKICLKAFKKHKFDKR